MNEELNIENIQLGDVVPVVLSTPYHQDPLATLAALRGSHSSGGEHLLLESAEIDSRENLKSLLLVDPSLRLVCQAERVTITALSDNGMCLLTFLESQLAATDTTVTRKTEQCLTVQFPKPAGHLNEDDRLQAISNVEPLRILQQQLKPLRQHPFAVFLGGVFAYDFYGSFETLPTASERAENECPDYQYYLAETLLVIDHQQQTTELVGTLAGGKNATERYQRLCQRMGEILSRLQIRRLQIMAKPATQHSATALPASPVQAVPDDETFKRQVNQLKEAIIDGDIFQVVPSRRFTLNCNDALSSYAVLKQQNPSPYMFYLQTQDFELFGASPESALKFTASSRQVELYPIAGTRKRARDKDGKLLLDQDSRIELELRMDKKEMAEHMMLVDLARNDLARIAVTGSRYVADLLKVDRYSHVMHLVSRVVATLRNEFDALDAYRACMNMGTLVGAPKLSAAHLIRNVEQQRRGSYGGAVGYLKGNGDMDTCIVIRAAFVKQGKAVVQAGAGVVFDSDANLELRETEQKAAAVINAIQTANQQQERTLCNEAL